MSFAQELKDARNKKGLTQKQLAERAGVATTTIIYAEGAGRDKKAKNPTLRFETLKQILISLDMAPDSTAFRGLALSWFADNLQSAITPAEERNILKKAKARPAWENEIDKLVEAARSTRSASKIELARWALETPRALSILRSLKAFAEDTSEKK